MKPATRKTRTAKPARATIRRSASRQVGFARMRKQIASATGCAPRDVTGDTILECFHRLWSTFTADERMMVWMGAITNITVKVRKGREWLEKGAPR